MKTKTIEELRKEFCEIYKLEYIPLMSNILFQYVQHLEQKLIQLETQKETIEELIKHRIEVYNDAMKKEEVKTDMSSQMYLRGAIEELKFIEQNIIQIKNK